ncbi:MAG: electron transfer flavoprotein beta subunit/FixA family protein [Candidatus Omnitrophota bacterium]|jgi:electron transfer flavoprotein beta subunit|nr:MAG: electron transfer flavoprotein beta subunit/FixA family protein [Candidatus Omnitrophota bacterium]
MHIIVPVKMVPDTTLVKIDPETNTLVREGVPFITNPFDTHAIEEALRLKDRYDAHVTVISMGPPSAEWVLRRALSLGADQAILLSDRVFGGADTLATSKVLSEAIKRLHNEHPVDLIICGMQTIDGDTAQVGPGIACRMKFTQLTLVDRILQLDLAQKRIQVRRKLEEYYESVEASLPALLTVVREINSLRYPTVPKKLESAETMIPVWSNEILKLDPNTIGLKGSPTNVRRIFAPQREKGEIIDAMGDNKDAAVNMIIDKLFEWNIVIQN